MSNKILTGKNGFTLVETLVAVAIITLAIGGPMLAASQSYIAALDAQNHLMASHLAQEGLEYVRMLRDNTYLEDAKNNVNDLSNTAFFDHFLNGVGNAPTSVYGCEGNPYNVSTNPTGLKGGDGSMACALDTSQPNTGVGGATYKLQPCPSVDTCPVLHRNASGLYTLVGTDPATIFTRTIQLYNFGGGVEVVSTVSWTYRGVAKKIVLTAYLMPWQ